MVPLLDEKTGRVQKYVSIRFDVSEKRQLLHTLQWRVGHDVLTGLPNRAYLSALLNQSPEFSRREDIPLTSCMFDLVGFKAVNDGYGHACGDLWLVEVATRLREIIRGEDVVARLAGDEFVLILRYVRDIDELNGALLRILKAISEPYSIQGAELN
ncbi:GGDEF domain-containing protein, partial [Neorhizobium galegae]|uniref:GGDEF domain-containing protein n=1 Tax=Neorhizobium galegae TaxID=399 RepID=UPI0021064F2E